jgi:hypothetical protein
MLVILGMRGWHFGHFCMRRQHFGLFVWEGRNAIFRIWGLENVIFVCGVSKMDKISSPPSSPILNGIALNIKVSPKGVNVFLWKCEYSTRSHFHWTVSNSLTDIDNETIQNYIIQLNHFKDHPFFWLNMSK